MNSLAGLIVVSSFPTFILLPVALIQTIFCSLMLALFVIAQ
jgi:hypothetical protein